MYILLEECKNNEVFAHVCTGILRPNTGSRDFAASHVVVSWVMGGTPSHHPFWIGSFPFTKTNQLLGTPHILGTMDATLSMNRWTWAQPPILNPIQESNILQSSLLASAVPVVSGYIYTHSYKGPTSRLLGLLHHRSTHENSPNCTPKLLISVRVWNSWGRWLVHGSGESEGFLEANAEGSKNPHRGRQWTGKVTIWEWLC